MCTARAEIARYNRITMENLYHKKMKIYTSLGMSARFFISIFFAFSPCSVFLSLVFIHPKPIRHHHHHHRPSSSNTIRRWKTFPQMFHLTNMHPNTFYWFFLLLLSFGFYFVVFCEWRKRLFFPPFQVFGVNFHVFPRSFEQNFQYFFLYSTASWIKYVKLSFLSFVARITSENLDIFFGPRILTIENELKWSGEGENERCNVHTQFFVSATTPTTYITIHSRRNRKNVEANSITSIILFAWLMKQIFMTKIQ